MRPGVGGGGAPGRQPPYWHLLVRCGSERDFVVQIATFRRVPRRAAGPCAGGSGTSGSGRRALAWRVTAAGTALCAAAETAFTATRAAIQHRKLAVEAADHDL